MTFHITEPVPSKKKVVGQTKTVSMKNVVEYSGFLNTLSGKSFGLYFGDNTPLKLLSTLSQTTDVLFSNDSTSCRYYFGHWKHNSPFIYKSVDLRNPSAASWVCMNSDLWNYVGHLLFVHYPKVFSCLSTARVPYKFGGVWAMACLNKNYPVVLHSDNKDYFEGICCVIITGDFSGGELCFPDENVMVKTKHGSIVFFESAKYRHLVNPFTGNRNSVTLFTPSAVL